MLAVSQNVPVGLVSLANLVDETGKGRLLCHDATQQGHLSVSVVFEQSVHLVSDLFVGVASATYEFYVQNAAFSGGISFDSFPHHLTTVFSLVFHQSGQALSSSRGLSLLLMKSAVVCVILKQMDIERHSK